MKKQRGMIRIAKCAMFCITVALATQLLSQTETTIYKFHWDTDGAWPMGTLASDKAGNLYGTTFEGGGSINCGFDSDMPWGCGTVFEVTAPTKENPEWKETPIYVFTNTGDGTNPAGGVVFDQSGNLYGVTSYGGTLETGTLFQLVPPASGSGPWTENTIYDFSTSMDGYDFPTYVVFDKAGNLYGINITGPYGSLFELSPPAGGAGTWTYTQIYTFSGPPNDGSTPLGGLAIDSSGDLYGITNEGGTSTNCYMGCGTVYELSPPSSKGGSWLETILYNFQGNPDGNYPGGGVLLGNDGNIYGTTPRGGTNGAYYGGYGTVYELAKPTKAGDPWVESVLYSFEGIDNSGGGPMGALIQDAEGNLYGTATPVAFELSPPSSGSGPWTETTLYNFVNWEGLGDILAGFTPHGNTLFGATMGGGNCNKHQCNGTVFKITP
jgi:hypothetical protein